MFTHKTIVLFFISLFTLMVCQAKTNNNITVENLRCRNFIDPEGVDFPLLSWEIKTSEEGISQTAWEIEIASRKELLQTGKPDVWKSGKQLSNEQFNIKIELPLKEATAYYWRVRIWDNSGKVTHWSDPAYFSIGLLNETSWSAKWITYPYSKERALPYFRKEFSLEDKKFPVKAIIYFCGLGAGELSLNGRNIDSTRFLDPAQTNYEQYALYSTFDATDFLQKGENCLGVMLGNGWFSQDRSWGGLSYGSPMFRLQLVMFFKDGSRTVLGSDESWRWKESPVYKTNIYLGESYDARREIKGWNKPGLSPDGWLPASIATENTPPRLMPQLIHPIRKKEVLSAKNVWLDSLGNWVYDFGVNIAGIPLIKVNQPAGTPITIRFAEEIDKDGNLDFESIGWVHHGEIFKDEYICKGGPQERWSPRFTYHGYRYAELSGISGKPDLTALKLVVVHSDVETIGTFECADEQINQLHEMAVRTVKSNLHGIPTDCPTREKCGWLGDVHAYVKMANLNFRMDNFWQKYLEDIRSGASKEEKNTLFHERYNNTFYFEDKPSGIPYMIAPGKRLCGVASPDWGTALVQLPWWMYVYYGNRQILEEYYPLMKQWTEYVESLAKNKERTKKYNTETTSIVYQGLGDWCPPLYPSTDNTPVEFTSTAFHYLDTHIMEEVARLLGKDGDAKMFASKKEAIAHEVIAVMYDKKNKTFGTQTADALALDLGLVPSGDEKDVANAIVRNMNEKSNGFMHCGIFGLCRIGSMLARNGNVQAAWNLFTKKGENSFEWMWTSANATSFWEILPINEISKEAIKREAASAGSHNHPMQAGIDVSFFEDVAGIRPDADGYGFKTIRFQPLFCDYLSWAKATIYSYYGKITSSWKKEKNLFEWNISIPPNSSGLVTFPYDDNITVNGIRLKECNFSKVETPNGTVSYRFPSGNYHIYRSEHCVH